MNYQKQFTPSSSINFNFGHLKSLLSIYFYTLGTLLGGLSIYLLSTLFDSSYSLTSWSGDTLFWFFIVMFSAIFVLFIPVEFIKNISIDNSSFRNLVANILFVIVISLISLLIFQVALENSGVAYQIKTITRAISFSGFIVMPFVLFVFHNLFKRVTFLSKYFYSLVLFCWIFSSQIFM